jgi:hypothetical protein
MREWVAADLHEELWTYRAQVTWNDCAHLKTPGNLRVRNALIRQYGAMSGFIKSFLNGDFYRQDDQNFVFTDEDIQLVKEIIANSPEPIRTGRIRFAADVSGGGDEQVVYGRDGTDMYFKAYMHEPNAAKLARILVEIATTHGCRPQDFYIDNGGLGKGIIDIMEEEHDYRGVHRYMNNQTSYYREWKDRITQDHYLFKEKLYSKAPIRLVNDPTLVSQLRERQYISDDHNVVKLEPKRMHIRRLKRSPDRLEALIMLWADYDPPHKPAKVVEPPYQSNLEENARKMGRSNAFAQMKQAPSLYDLNRNARN